MGTITHMDAFRPLVLTDDQRRAIAAQIEALIGLLDAADGDPDLEPEVDMDSARDDGCGPIHLNGRVVWGSDHDGCYDAMLPRYGRDQSRGPINGAEGTKSYLRGMEEGR